MTKTQQKQLKITDHKSNEQQEPVKKQLSFKKGSKGKKKVIFATSKEELLNKLEQEIKKREATVEKLTDKLTKEQELLELMKAVIATREAKSLKNFKEVKEQITNNHVLKKSFSKQLITALTLLENDYKNKKQKELETKITLEGTFVQGNYPDLKIVINPNLSINVHFDEYNNTTSIDGKEINSLSINKVIREITTIAKKTNIVALEDQQLVFIFKNVYQLVRRLRGNSSSYIPIIDYLQLVQTVLVNFGCYYPFETLKKEFGRLFVQLEIIPEKGRDSNKFVKITDNFGNVEDFVFLKL